MAPKQILMLVSDFLETDKVVVDGRLVTAFFWPIRHERIRKIPQQAVDTRNGP